MILLPNQTKIAWVENFNATTSLVNCGALSNQHYPFAQTICAVMNPAGAGEVGTNTIFNLTGSADTNGPRLRLGDSGGSQYTVNFNASSTGTSGSPSRTGAASLATGYSAPGFVCASWDGSLNATGIRLFNSTSNLSVGNTEVIEMTYSGPADGTTAPFNGLGNQLVIGNRPDAGRTFNGDIYYIARWNRVLDPMEIRIARWRGPLSVADGLIYCRVNGRDIVGKIGDITRTAVGIRAPGIGFWPIGQTTRQLFPYMGTGTLKTKNNLATGSIKTFQGLAKASTKTVNGLTP